jgi:hypothetical protein
MKASEERYPVGEEESNSFFSRDNSLLAKQSYCTLQKDAKKYRNFIFKNH